MVISFSSLLARFAGRPVSASSTVRGGTRLAMGGRKGMGWKPRRKAEMEHVDGNVY